MESAELFSSVNVISSVCEYQLPYLLPPCHGLVLSVPFISAFLRNLQYQFIWVADVILLIRRRLSNSFMCSFLPFIVSSNAKCLLKSCGNLILLNWKYCVCEIRAIYQRHKQRIFFSQIVAYFSVLNKVFQNERILFYFMTHVFVYYQVFPPQGYKDFLLKAL